MPFGAETSYPHSEHLQMSMTERIVAKFTSSLQDGHHIYTDRYYTSLPLMQHLKNNNHYLTVTVNVNRRGLPVETKNLRLEKFETKFFENGDGDSVCMWRDKKAKKNVVMASSFHENEIEAIRGKRETINVPAMMADYNKNMGGIDRFDQLVGYYSIVRRKTIK